MDQVSIEFLADHPETIPVLAPWLHEQWGDLSPGSSVPGREAELRAHCNRDQIPLAVIAFINGELTGTAGLVKHDMETRKELSPWLASVFVTPEHRGKGIGTALTERIVQEAGTIGVSVLYLFTPDAEDFYARIGWSVVEYTEYRGQSVVIMKTEPPPGTGR